MQVNPNRWGASGSVEAKECRRRGSGRCAVSSKLTDATPGEASLDVDDGTWGVGKSTSGGRKYLDFKLPSWAGEQLLPMAGILGRRWVQTQ